MGEAPATSYTPPSQTQVPSRWTEKVSRNWRLSGETLVKHCTMPVNMPIHPNPMCMQSKVCVASSVMSIHIGVPPITHKSGKKGFQITIYRQELQKIKFDRLFQNPLS